MNAKPFLTYDQQLDKLVDEKGLLVPDRLAAVEALKQTGYFSLVGGYKEPFKDKSTGKYMPGTSFDHIVALYDFDDDLRALFLQYMCRIEQHLRSLISYCFVDKYGEDQEQYLNSANYRAADPRTERRLGEFLNILSRNMHNDEWQYVRHQDMKHHNIPLRALMHTLTFGQLSKMYAFLDFSTQARVSRELPDVDEKKLRQYLTLLTKFRNVCAHNERFFSHRVQEAFPDTGLHRRLQIPQSGGFYVCGKRDLFGVVIAYRYLLREQDFRRFWDRLCHLIERYLRNSHAMAGALLFEKMGFPQNWMELDQLPR